MKDRTTRVNESTGSVRLQLAERLKDARVSAGLSQAQLGALLGVTQSGISYYENAGRSIDPDLLWECSRVLNRPFSYFLDDSSEGFRFPRESEIAQMVEGLERHHEDVTELSIYRAFLRQRATRPTAAD